jgi:hypothetical protein
MSRENKHTPGRWEWADDDLIGAGGKQVIESIPYEGMWIDPKSPDARLMAAAPCLLDFAVALDADWTEEFPDGPDTDFSDRLIKLSDRSVRLWRQCRAAIARATGASHD